MTPADLLQSLRQRGFTLWAEVQGDQWRPMINPASKLTEADRAQIAQHRDALLDLLFFEVPFVDRNGPGPGYFFRPPHWSAEWEEEE